MSITEHDEIHFPSQRPNEHVVLMLRRHWTVLAREVVQLIVMLLIPPIFLALLFLFTEFTLDPNTPIYILTVMALSIYYLFTFVTYFHDFVDYHLDVWIVTDQRIISIEQEGLFNRVTSELNVTKLQDVTSEIKGKVQTLLDYGQVYVQTAGEQKRFVFEQVPHPAEVAKVILQLHDRGLRMQHLQEVKEGVQYEQQLTQQSNEGQYMVQPQEQSMPYPQPGTAAQNPQASNRPPIPPPPQ